MIVSNHLLKILNTQGPMGVVLRLKVSLIALNAFIGGCPLKSTHPLGAYVSLSNGLPSWIPKNIRAQIRSKDLTVIRIWASFLNTYKGIKGTWKKPTADTIMAEPCTADFSPLRDFAGYFWIFQNWAPQRLIRGAAGFCSNLRIGGLLPYFISAKAGPNGSPAYLGKNVLLDVIAWYHHPKGLSILRGMASTFNLDWILSDLDKIHEWIVTKLPIHPSLFTDYLHILYNCPDSSLNRRLRKKFWKEEKLNFLQSKGITVDKNGPVHKKDWDHSIQLIDDHLAERSPYRQMSIEDQLYYLYHTKTVQNSAEALPPHLKEALQLYLAAEFPEMISLGTLHVIQEAAGKSRIIAINDFFTQQVLNPLHKWLFAICKCFPQDATFDQEGALIKFAARDDIKEYYSYDLTSATDLIPIQIYQAVLAPIIGTSRITIWLDLLVNKLFRCPKNIQAKDKNGQQSKFVTYTRGQPMGALSSWGLMNLAHHILVQFSVLYSVVNSLSQLQHKSPYWYLIDTERYSFLKIIMCSGSSFERLYKIEPLVLLDLTKILFHSGILPFDKYVVLGDDVVIGDRKVAEGYYCIMNNIFGVPIKLAKSYVSDKLFNFANQTYLGKNNISPAPFKELLVGESLTARFEFASRVVRRWYTECSFVKYMRLVVTTQVYLRWRKDIMVGKVFKPILPVIYALTMVGAPIIGLPTIEDPTTDKGKLGVSECLSASPTSVYYDLLGGKDKVYDIYKLADPSNKLSAAFLKYFTYLIKCFAAPYLGDPQESIEICTKKFPEYIRMCPTKLAILGLIRYNRCETIWIFHSKEFLLERAREVKKILEGFRKPHLVTPNLILETLSLLVSRPDLFKILDVLAFRYAQTPDAMLPVYEVALKSTMRSVKDLMHEEKGFSPEERKIRELTLTRIIKCTARYLELGGDFKPLEATNGYNPEYLAISKEGGSSTGEVDQCTRERASSEKG
jgi:hypothetical protein